MNWHLWTTLEDEIEDAHEDATSPQGHWLDGPRSRTAYAYALAQALDNAANEHAARMIRSANGCE